MSVAWIRASTVRLIAGLAAVALSAGLGACTSAPKPQPTPTATPPTTPSPTTPTNPEPTPSEPDYVVLLEQFSRRMLDAGSPAVLVQMRVRGQEWSMSYGVRSLEGNAPAQLTDPVHVGSITQSMVAVSVLKLVEEGRLELEDPVSKYVPEFDGVMHPPGPVTVRRLLAHTTGMPDYYRPLFGPSVEPSRVRDALSKPLALEEQLAVAGSQPWQERLAQGFEYSNSNYAALGLVVQRLRGRPLGDLIRDDVSEPLGLDGTFMTSPGPPPAAMIHGYALVGGERVDVTYPAVQVGSASGMVSTVPDVNAFFAGLLQGKLVERATLAEMQSPFNAFYGLGLYRWSDTCANSHYFGNTGDIPGYGSIAMSSADAERQLAMTVAYPPRPISAQASPIVGQMVTVAQETLDATC